MKKLKIFLLLSILLCFGFTLNIEVHAQGYGSNAFKTGVVLPATSQLRIIVDIPSSVGSMSASRTGTTGGYLRFVVYNNGTGGENNEGYYCDVRLDGSWISLTDYNLSELINNEWIPSEDVGYSIISIILDTSTWTETQRTITSDNHDTHPIYWEDLNAPSGYSITFEENGGTTVTDLTNQTALPNPLPIPTKENHTFLGWYYNSAFTQIANPGDIIESNVTLYAKWEQVTSNAKVFEVGVVLPRTTQLRISWPTITSSDFTQTDNKWIRTYDHEFFIYIQYESFYSQEFITFRINYNLIYNTGEWVSPYTDKNGNHAYIDLDTSLWTIEQRTIVQVDTDTVLNALTWEDLNPLSSDYADGYADGFADAEVTYELGYERARDEYAYYDPNTDQWLSVEEYLDLYGTDKPGQSDFYNNFDKYFIPAMIIVFGGAIVLTILKVFKGRE